MCWPFLSPGRRTYNWPREPELKPPETRETRYIPKCRRELLRITGHYDNLRRGQTAHRSRRRLGRYPKSCTWPYHSHRKSAPYQGRGIAESAAGGLSRFQFANQNSPPRSFSPLDLFLQEERPGTVEQATVNGRKKSPPDRRPKSIRGRQQASNGSAGGLQNKILIRA